MLTHLSIKNLAVVSEVSIDIPEGMSVVTGETGVGKSLIVDGLALLLGQRADAGIIGQAGTSAEISAVFSIVGISAAETWLAARSLSAPDSEIIVRRVIRSDGPSRAFVNGSPITLTELKTLGQHLIDIHAQHEHQALLQRETQRQLLDDFADASALRFELRSSFEHWATLKKRQSELLAGQKDRDDRIGYLNYQLTELSALAIQPDEVDALDTELRQLSQIESSLSLIQEAIASLSQDDQGGLSALNRAKRALDQVQDPRLGATAQLLTQSVIQVEELNRDLEGFLVNHQANPERMHWIENRLQDIQDVARKHRCDPRTLPSLEADLAMELDELSDSDASVASMTDSIAAAEIEWQKLARKLSKKRRDTIKPLEQAVQNLLQKMGMSDAKLKIELTPTEELNPLGHEDIRFLVTTNAGQAPQPLGKTASGGELSRISLAIQVATLGSQDVPTIVFDEVDVGIGGAVAETIGALLRKLGSASQVLVVTHLGQVAAQGHHHFSVHKQSGVSAITPLDATGSLEEIARMLSGTKITAQSRAHAQAMIDQARSNDA